jgi:hypothetical protein
VAVDVPPKKKTTPREKIARLVRLPGARERGERAGAWHALERTMKSEDVSWTDLGDWIEHSYSEQEMLEVVDVVRKEERQRAQQSAARSNGHFVLPSPAEMADFCEARRNQLKDDNQRKFIDEMVWTTHQMSHRRLHPKTLGFLVSLYIKHGGRI